MSEKPKPAEPESPKPAEPESPKPAESESPEPAEPESPEPTEIEIPEPAETGSEGTQEVGVPETLTADQQSPLEGLAIAHRIEGLAASHSRSMGGEIAANLFAGAFTQLTYDLQETKKELDSTRKNSDSTREKLSDYKTKSAVLQERIKSISKTGHIKKMNIAFGTIIIAIGVDLYRNDIDKLAYVLGVLGVLLILLGWFSKEGSAEI